jgi:hypothetical protein
MSTNDPMRGHGEGASQQDVAAMAVAVAAARQQLADFVMTTPPEHLDLLAWLLRTAGRSATEMQHHQAIGAGPPPRGEVFDLWRHVLDGLIDTVPDRWRPSQPRLLAGALFTGLDRHFTDHEPHGAAEDPG